jgi:hypothetical protein
MKSFASLLAVAFLLVPLYAQHQHGTAAPPDDPHEHVMTASTMSARHMESTSHMQMTPLRPLRPGDEERAQHVLASARQALERYRDYHLAERDGFKIFLPNVPQKIYHFTNYRYGFQAAFHFNPEHPTSLLYEKTADGYRLVGAMYTAPYHTSPEKLDARIPLSVVQWHLHTNLCAAPRGQETDYLQPNARFGLRGSIATRQPCEQAGGKFHDHVFGWMVHVYPFDQDAFAAH